MTIAPVPSVAPLDVASLRAALDKLTAAGRPLYCFGVAKDGQPRHTLMLAYDTPLVPWRAPQ